ncbi:MAG: hypothetical protein EOP06_24750 [Proteobacteria bacterium]|nr:MAG: hypothetical protein EOP06_24750 [Pseudomonadota bacterium]
MMNPFRPDAEKSALARMDTRRETQISRSEQESLVAMKLETVGHSHTIAHELSVNLQRRAKIQSDRILVEQDISVHETELRFAIVANRAGTMGTI